MTSLHVNPTKKLKLMYCQNLGIPQAESEACFVPTLKPK
jgi:hypothetical protein